jgi:hypothetical protein
MNSQQLKSMYVTADLVNHNFKPVSLQQLQQLQQIQQPPTQPQKQEQINVSDVFEIPDFDIPVASIANTPVLQQPRPAHAPQPTNVGVMNIIPSLSPSQVSSPTGVNLIHSINQNAMTDVMNQIANANQKQKTPSITTKHTDVSIQSPLQNQQHQSSPAPRTTSPRTTSPVLSAAKKITSKPVLNKNALNKKVIVEDEDKDSAVDYDDDDPEIKKTKLSLFHFAKDITFNLIFAIPFLQKARLNAMLKDPTLAINQIERIFDEFKDQMTQFELESIKKYVCEDGIRDQLNYILESGFNKILSDGIIDINDAPQFNQLVYYIIKSFNDINHGKVYRFFISREHVMLLLHFVLKSVFTLTLKGQEEQMAIGLLDTSFKLVQLEVLPIVSKRWYHKFRICKSAKQIEDIIE